MKPISASRVNWYDEHNLIMVDCHVFGRPYLGGPQNADYCPMEGFRYQSFLEQRVFVSLANSSDIKQIERDASLGRKLHVTSILQLDDSHSEILQTLLADDKVSSEPVFGYSLPQVAMLHNREKNTGLSSAICMHLVRQGDARKLLHDDTKKLFGDEEIGQLYLEMILPILDAAESVVRYQKLDKELGSKPTSKLIKL